MIDKTKLETLLDQTNKEVAIAKEMSDKIVSDFTCDLDNIMRDINRYIVSQDDVPDAILQRYFMELSNAYYFIAAKCESAGLYDDISKTNAKVRYNEAYGNNQVQAAAEGRKMTVAELTVAAEQDSLSESLVSQIYSRSYKIIKTKLEAAQTQISTLGKILNSHDIERKMSGVSTV
jgi:hypothetical protein